MFIAVTPCEVLCDDKASGQAPQDPTDRGPVQGAKFLVDGV